MRKGIFKTFLIAGMACFMFLLGPGAVNAQSGLTDDFYAAPAGSFVNSNDAQVILSDHVTALKTFLATLTPGSPAHKTTVRAVDFYNEILQGVYDGKQIPESIAQGTQVFTRATHGEATKAEKSGLKLQAIDMLDN